MTILRALLGSSTSINSSDLASLPASGTPSDAYVLPALNTAGAAVGLSLGSLLSWVQGHYPDLSTTTPRLLLTGSAPLDASSMNRRLVVATPASGATLTLSAPTAFANLGTNFYCDLINYGPGSLAFGAGITSSYTTLAVGQSARIVAFTVGAANVIEALFAAPLNTTPAITATAPTTVPAVPSGGSTVAVPIPVAMMNFSAAPSLQYALDGAAYAALPSGASTSTTAVTGFSLALGGGAHTLLLRDTGTGTVSNTLTFNVESETLAGVPTSGWTVGTAKVLTGATTVLAGLTTAYAVLWNGSAEVGSRQAFTSSATLAALSFTPAAANTSTTIRAFDAATGGTLLAESPAITVAAAAGVPPIFSLNSNYQSGSADSGSVVAGNYRFHGWAQGGTINPATITPHNGSGGYTQVPSMRFWIERVTPVGTGGYQNNGRDPADGQTPGFAKNVTIGWVTTPGSTAYATVSGSANSTGSVPMNASGTTASGNYGEVDYYGPDVPGTYYYQITTANTDGTTTVACMGPITVTS